MIIKYLTILIIVMLIFTNGITDAPNAIATLVGAEILKFKNAAFISAVFNFFGVIVMSFINISVANCIGSVVKLSGGVMGIVCLICAMLSVIIFAFIAMQFGIPTSETHGLVAGLTGSAIALYGFNSINLNEWFNIGSGLFFSVFGCFFISYLVTKFCRIFKEQSDNIISKFQIIGMCVMSFMHGAQDGQKFIGILIAYNYILKNIKIPEYINPINHIQIIIFVAFIMFVGVSTGGKKIVKNIGSDMTKLSKKEALYSDIATSLTLLFASLNGLPVSTSHVKTVSIISIGCIEKVEVSKKNVVQIIKAWILTFPICMGIAYALATFFIMYKKF